MAHAENSILIDKPINEVFQFIANGENNKFWRPAVLEIHRIGDKNGLGAYYEQTLKAPMGNIRGDYEVNEYEDNKVLGFHVKTGPARPSGRYNFKEQDGKTLVHFSLSLEPKGFMGKMMDGMIQKTMEGEVANLKNLKEYLESH